MSIEQYSYGIDHINSRKANVIDFYKEWQTQDIRADLQENRSDAIMIFQNVDYNINIGCGIRSNNAFLGKAVYICGRRKYDKRSTAGTAHYEHVYHADTLKEVIDYVHTLGYTVYAIDNIMEYSPVNLLDVTLPKRSAFVFGEEGLGLSSDDIHLCDGMLFIGMYGSVRSLNVAVAAGIVQYEYCRQWR
jgi:tRNA G18 (ribose-2'-O)-methylase SpoU